MLGPQSTTRDWQLHSGRIVVLPVGSFEQHGSHLPLDMDIQGSTFFAKVLAEDLNAAVLPALPFGTCAEHTGFRGSISLRPETHMQLIRDIADELEVQNFHYLILLNGHGGNFSLGPAARWMNRTDRKLRVLIINWWEFVAPGILQAPGMEIHAGELETSLMMAIAPDTVRSEFIPHGEKVRLPSTAAQLKQSDLNNFGTGYFNPAGYVGFPWLATAEKGEAIVASVREGMKAHVQDRLALFDRSSGFAGPGGIALRPLEPSDLEAGMKLKAAANWNQTAADWQFFLRQPNAGFAALRNGEVIGSVTTLNFEPTLETPGVSWIGMMLVDPAFRGAGIGRQLMEAAIASIPDGYVIGLDATAAGKPLYEKLGFREVSRIGRLVRRHPPMGAGLFELQKIRPLTPKDIARLAELDARSLGANRKDLLAELLQYSDSAWGVEEEGRLTGFCLGRPGANYYQLGPVVAESEDGAMALIDSLSLEVGWGPVVIDVPLDHQPLLTWLKDLGFVQEREFVRMLLGEAVLKDEPGLLWAIAGPELA